jgi:hypothetical protein
MFQEADAKAIDAARPRDQEGIPGLWWLAIATLLSAIACWFWLIPAVSPTRGAAAPGPVEAELAQVEEGDIVGALTTMVGGPDFLARFRPSNRSCAQPLAWVTVSRAPGQPGGAVRLRSGTYVSPLFDLSDVPRRVAIPYPAPYETGHGTLTVLASGGRPVIALSPAWKPAVYNGQDSQAVSWSVRKCRRAHG